MNKRQTDVNRRTNETDIALSLCLDGGGGCDINSGVPFFDHMLAQTARHGALDLTLRAQGDLHIDAHHTLEDCGIALGEALATCLGDKTGVRRFAHAYAPLDEALARAVVDLSGRAGLSYHVALSRVEVGGIDADLFREFFQALTHNAKITLHLDLLRGVNAHHQIEAVFKAFGIALAAAATRGGGGVPSTKGVL